MTIDESVENRKIVGEALDRLHVGLIPFVAATVNKWFPDLVRGDREQLRKICYPGQDNRGRQQKPGRSQNRGQENPGRQSEKANPLPEWPDTFKGMDLLAILNLIGHKEAPRCRAAFQRDFGGIIHHSLYGDFRRLKEHRNQHSHPTENNPFTLTQVRMVLATASTWLEAIPDIYPEAKEQLAKLEDLQLQVGRPREETQTPRDPVQDSSDDPLDNVEYLLRKPVLDDIADSWDERAADDPRVRHISDPERQKARLGELAIRHSELAAAASHREDFDVDQILEQMSDDDPAVRQAAEKADIALSEVGTARTVMDLFGVIEREPENAEAYKFRGTIYHHVLKWHEEAKADYTEAIKLNPQDAENYVSRGACHFALEAYGAAIEDCEKAIDLDPDDANAYHLRGNCHVKLEEYEAAIEYYNQAIKLNPEDDFAYNNRGFCHFQLQQYQKALADNTKAIDLYRNSFFSVNPRKVEERAKANDLERARRYENRGDSYRALERYEEAIDDYTEATKLDPQSAYAYSRRGNCHYALEESAKASEDYTEVINLNPESAFAYSRRGNCHYALEEYAEAIEDFDEVIKLNDQDASAYSRRGNCHRALERYGEASKDYTAAINLNPENAAAHYHRGFCYIELQQYEKALEDYDKAIELIPENAILYYNRGHCYLELQRFEDAVGAFTAAIDISPEAQFYQLRGEAYELWGNQAEGDEQSKLFDRALADFEEADRLEVVQ